MPWLQVLPLELFQTVAAGERQRLVDSGWWAVLNPKAIELVNGVPFRGRHPPW